jgi:AMP deaminase
MMMDGISELDQDLNDTLSHQMQFDAVAERQLAQLDARVVSHWGVQDHAEPTIVADALVYEAAGTSNTVSSSDNRHNRLRLQTAAELSKIARDIRGIVELRRKYIALSLQRAEDNPRDAHNWESYPPPHDPTCQRANSDALDTQNLKKKGAEEFCTGCFSMDYTSPLPSLDTLTFGLGKDGVYKLHTNSDGDALPIKVPTIREFYMDLNQILKVSSDGPSKSFAFGRLQYLEGNFNLYALTNGYQESVECKEVPHRDFYNVRKVDTHIHHSACMNQKHLLRFIKKKLKNYPDEVVLSKNGTQLTLSQVFASLNLTAYDLSIDTLDMHVSNSDLYYISNDY